MTSPILKRGYKAKLLRDRRDAVEMGTEYVLATGKHLTEEQLRSLLKATRTDDESGGMDVIDNWYKDNWPEAYEQIKELELDKELNG